MRKIAAALLLLLASAAFADGKVWQKLLEDSVAALKDGDYEKSLSLTRRVTREMMDTMGPGKPAEKALAITVLHRAVAEAGRGNMTDAEWYWDVASSLDPTLPRNRLDAFGPAGEKLETPPPPPPTPARKLSGDETITPPKVIQRVEPAYPLGARYFSESGVLIVEVIIEDDGRVHSPKILKALGAPTISLAALEAVKQWKFDPAKVDGKPIPVIFNLTVNFKLTR